MGEFNKYPTWFHFFYVILLHSKLGKQKSLLLFISKIALHVKAGE